MRYLMTLFILLFAVPAGAAIIKVTSTADSGPGTLRDAVGRASPSDTIIVTGTIALIDPIAIDQNLTIEGPATISGGFNSQIFTVSAAVTLKGLVIEGGSGESPEVRGVGIDNAGALTLVNCIVQYNAGDGVSAVAGIFNSGSLTLKQSAVGGNFARFGTAGIFNAGAIKLVDSVIAGNFGQFSDGGGIDNGGTVSITNSLIAGNRVSNGNGGGIFNAGTLTITGSEVSQNFANANFPVGGFGGGIINNGGTLKVINSVIEGNDGIQGGGDIAFEGGMLKVVNSTVGDIDFSRYLTADCAPGTDLSGDIQHLVCN